MITEGVIIQNKIKDRITEIENEYNIQLSTIQKILLSINGPIPSILDIVYGDVKLFIIKQNIEKADKDTAKYLELDEGAELYYREVILHKRGAPLAFAKSIVPTERCSPEVIEDLDKKQKSTSAILYSHDVETTRKITKIDLEKPTLTHKELFKSGDDLLTREFVMMHNKKIVLWSSESFPLSHFIV